eukprot:CAMPEP_0174986248 /NCGR_PEP_ID=MMETSP0004_2-20121128/18822_1 /TAXON_ID=420556 /ORGANISM="Ochromonas sp., Strain CCMP1393" /LENGTH=73 /DNA_ID=CAMNT_0016239047 /DNA_START=59 /DNA_END=277 /DNA_ORIENTATION=+
MIRKTLKIAKRVGKVVVPGLLSVGEEVPLIGNAVKVIQKLYKVYNQIEENREAYSKLIEVVEKCERYLDEYKE